MRLSSLILILVAMSCPVHADDNTQAILMNLANQWQQQPQPENRNTYREHCRTYWRYNAMTGKKELEMDCESN